MILKNGCPVLICAALLAWAGPSVADGYRADQFLGLDLSKAVLSPKPLGPETHFAPVPVEAASDHDGEAAQARAEPKPAPHVVVPKTAAGDSDRDPGRARACGQTPPAGSDPAGAPPSRQPARRRGLRYPDPGLALQIRRHLQLAAAGQLEQIHLNGFILRDASLRDAPQMRSRIIPTATISDSSCPHLLRASTSSKPFHIKRRGWPGRARPRRCGWVNANGRWYQTLMVRSAPSRVSNHEASVARSTFAHASRYSRSAPARRIRDGTPRPARRRLRGSGDVTDWRSTAATGCRHRPCRCTIPAPD